MLSRKTQSPNRARRTRPQALAGLLQGHTATVIERLNPGVDGREHFRRLDEGSSGIECEQALENGLPFTVVECGSSLSISVMLMAVIYLGRMPPATRLFPADGIGFGRGEVYELGHARRRLTSL